MRYLIATLITAAFIFTWNKSFGETITTGNLLPNSGDGVDWNSSSTDQINSANSSGYVSNGSTINGFDITCSASQSNCGYRYSVGGDFEVTGTATVSVDDIALTNNSINQSMLDNGITLNSYIDVANCESTEGNCESKGGNNDSHTTTIVLKDSSGNVLSTTTQTRTDVTGFQGNCNGYPGTTTTGITANCGQYNDRIIYLGLGSNKVDWSWSGTDSNYTNQSRQGPNLLGASLNMTYNNTEYNPIDDDAQETIEDIDEDITDIIEDIPEDFDWYTDEIVLDDTYTWEDDFYFEEEIETIDFDIIEFEELPIFEDFETFEEMPIIEEVFFEEDYMLEPPPMEMMEEIFTEEFEEDFTDFLEETGMEEEFMEFLEEEGITAEEFFEEITEEEFNDELTEESFEEFEEPLEEVSTDEESIPETVETEEETMEVKSESELKEEKEVAQNESNEQEEEVQEEESDSTGTEESEVQTAESEEQEDIQSEDREMDTDTGVTTDVAKVESKLKKNLKAIAKQIAKVTKETTQNLSKEDLFFKSNTLDAYNKVQFYKSKEIYTEQNLDLFNQIDLGVYSKDIYTTVTLSSYVNNDPVEIHKRKLQDIQVKKNKILKELEILKQ